MKSRIKEEAKKYIKEMGEITLSTFKDKMRIDKSDAKELLWELVADGFVEHSVGFLFRCVETDTKHTKQDEGDKSQDCSRRSAYEELFGLNKETKVEVSEKEELDYQRDRLEQRRRELLHRMEAELADDDDDDDDYYDKDDDEWLFFDDDDEDDEDEEDEEDDEDDEDDEEYYDKEESEEWIFDDEDDDDDDDDVEKTINKIRKETLKKLSTSEEPSEDAEDEEETDDDDTALREPIEITVEDIEKRRTLAKIATSFGCGGEFTRVGEEYYCTLGVVYPNDMPMTFKLSYKDKIILSDYGLTHRYISTSFDMSDPKVQELIQKIMEEYNLTWISERERKELSIQILDQGGAFISFLYFFSAIERISNISHDKWYKIASEKEDAFCKEETFKILFEQKATYEEAIQTARNLYMQAQAEGDEFKQHAYKIIGELFEGIGAENFEYFKQSLLEGEEE